jgi:hypothetical protein
LPFLQLGVNNNSSYGNAVVSGRLFGKPQFFGTAVSESVSMAGSLGSWNSGYVQSVEETWPWQIRSGSSAFGADSGLTIFHRDMGNILPNTSHRTILSGY